MRNQGPIEQRRIPLIAILKDICFNGPEGKVGYKLKIINGFPEIVPILHYNSQQILRRRNKLICDKDSCYLENGGVRVDRGKNYAIWSD